MVKISVRRPTGPGVQPKPSSLAVGAITPLREVEIDNFRGIRKLKLELDPQVTVLFGPNAAGKTTILDAIAIGLGAYVARVPKALGRAFARSGDLRVPWKDRSHLDEHRGVERTQASIVLRTGGGVQWGVTYWRSAQDRQTGLSKVGPSELQQVIDPLIMQVLDAIPGSLTSPLPLVVAYGTERAVVELPLRERNFQKEFSRLSALDQALRATTRFKTVFEWFRAMEDEERRGREQRRDFDFKLPELEWVRHAVEQAEIHCRNPRVETKPIRMLVDFMHHASEAEPLDINSLSDGYRTHFALVVDVARRMVQLNPSDQLNDPGRGTNSPAVILIDEVDLHLDPSWQGRVLRGLRQAFPNAQFIVTTHSEQVLGSVHASQVRKLVWGDGEIEVERVKFAQGATGERILIELMDAPERVTGPVTEQLRRYLRLIDQGSGRTPEAVGLRAELDQLLPGDAQLHHADLELQRRELVARLRLGQQP